MEYKVQLSKVTDVVKQNVIDSLIEESVANEPSLDIDNAKRRY